MTPELGKKFLEILDQKIKNEQAKWIYDGYNSDEWNDQSISDEEFDELQKSNFVEQIDYRRVNDKVSVTLKFEHPSFNKPAFLVTINGYYSSYDGNDYSDGTCFYSKPYTHTEIRYCKL